MDPVSIVVICAVSFGGIVTLASLVHQYFLTRNQRLHQMAEERVMRYQAHALERIRREIKKDRLKSHRILLNENKEAISHLDEQISNVMSEKASLVGRFSEVISEEIKKGSRGVFSKRHQNNMKALKTELSMTLEALDERLLYYQEQRNNLLKDKTQIESDIQEKEIEQNNSLNELYKQHGAYLEKLQLMQSEHRYKLAESIVKATTTLFDKLILAPARIVSAYFSKSSDIDTEQSQNEIDLRAKVQALEARLKIDVQTKHLNTELSL